MTTIFFCCKSDPQQTLKRSPFQKPREERKRCIIPKCGYHMPGQANRNEREILVAADNIIARGVSLRDCVARRGVVVPRVPRLLLCQHALSLESRRPFFIAVVRHAIIGVPIVNQYAELLGKEGPQRNRRGPTRVIIKLDGVGLFKVERSHDLWAFQPVAQSIDAAAGPRVPSRQFGEVATLFVCRVRRFGEVRT